MKKFAKPNYIKPEFVTATKHGWVDNRTNEILVSIPNLLEKIKQEKAKIKLEKEVASIVEEEVKTKVEVTESKIEDKVEAVIEAEPVKTEEAKVEVAEVVKPKRGPKPKVK